jgi:hypothetical protein
MRIKTLHRSWLEAPEATNTKLTNTAHQKGLSLSVADPERDLDLQDLYVFGPPRSIIYDSIILQSSKNSKKNLNSYCIVTSLWFLSLCNDVNVASKSNKQKKFMNNFLLSSWRSLAKIPGSVAGVWSESFGQRYRFVDPDPYPNVMDLLSTFPPSWSVS